LKATWKKISNILSWVLLVAMVLLLIFTVKNTMEAKKSGESVFLLGYRPVLVLTGSMEPYMMTNSVALTKEVTDIDQLDVGDVITYHKETEEGRILRITHRIIAIDNGNIYTKGDNNRVEDGYSLSIENVEAEVVTVFNQTAWIAQKWQTTTGKVMIISFTLCIILLYIMVKNMIIALWRKKSDPQETPAEKAAQASECEPASEPEESAALDYAKKTE